MIPTHKVVVVVDFLAGALAFVAPWVYAVREWPGRPQNHVLITAGAFVLAGVCFSAFALRHALYLGGHYWLSRAVRFVALALALPSIAGLVVAAVLNARAAKHDKAERRRELAKDSPYPPPNESA